MRTVRSRTVAWHPHALCARHRGRQAPASRHRRSRRIHSFRTINVGAGWAAAVARPIQCTAEYVIAVRKRHVRPLGARKPKKSARRGGGSGGERRDAGERENTQDSASVRAEPDLPKVCVGALELQPLLRLSLALRLCLRVQLCADGLRNRRTNRRCNRTPQSATRCRTRLGQRNTSHRVHGRGAGGARCFGADQARLPARCTWLPR